MKKFLFVSWLILIAILAASCQFPESKNTIATPTFTSTPNAESVENMINPGGKIGDMVLTIGYGGGVPEIWEYCDPIVTEPGVIRKECQVPALPVILIGYGYFASTVEELDASWSSMKWELYIDDQPVNLPAFGTFDKDDNLNGPVKFRSWNVLLEQPMPGQHTMRYVIAENDMVWDVTWNFTVASPATMDIPVGAESLPFIGTSSAFSTLAEFNTLMKSAVAGGDVDSFWNAVISSRQMPLIFGDSIAVFLYRGQAGKIECRGDFTTPYLRQGETDLWAFIKQFEPDARLEYKIVLDSGESMLDPLNPLTETGGLGTNSVVQMPQFVIPEFTLSREGIEHGTLSENISISSRSLGYDVNYRVYTPVGYDTLDNLPVIYVTDGQDFINPEMGAMVNALDSLIANDSIEPVIAVFIDQRDPITGSNRREAELVPESLETCPFCDFIASELVPAIDTTYKTNPSPDVRSIMGFSLGGNFTAHMGLAHANVFHQIAILSPYISAEWIFNTYQEAEQLPLKIFLSHGTYDTRAASIRLRDILELKRYPLLYIETHTGHSYGNVRDMLDDLLIYFFGVA